MLQNNPLLAQLKQQLHAQTPRVEGVIKGTEKGFGFLEADGQTSYFIPPPYMKKVMHGDRVIATLNKEKERDVAEPETLVEPFLSRFVGRIHKKNDDRRVWVIPDHPLIKEAILAKPAQGVNESLEAGDWVVAEMRTHPLRGERGFTAEITQFITRAGDHFAPWWVTLSRHQLQREAPTLPQELPLEERERTDLTSLHFITIDSATTEDMDDALYIEEGPDGQLKLWVAIADPTAYIPCDSELDKVAYQRQFTHYLPGFDIPMLPRELSDTLCSLRPNERRPAVVCAMTIAADGALPEQIDFTCAWIESKAKLVYDDVSDWLEQADSGQEAQWQPATGEIANQLKLLQRFSQLRQQWRQQHSLLFRDRPDYRFVLDDKGDVLDIVTEQRRAANRMVEEAMIAANIHAAAWLKSQLGYGIFNTHNGFEPAQIDAVLKILKEQGAEYTAEQLLSLKGFCELRRYLDALPSSWLDSRLRRYQTLAEVSTQPGCHFGLGVEAYATWTSPIRKYSDMVNHRLMKALIYQQTVSEPSQEMVQLISDRRRLTRVAERDISDWLYTRYLANKADGSTRHPAEVIDISRGGMRVRLMECGAVAFIPAPFIHSVRDELVCSQENGMVLVKGEERYRLGDSLQVVLHEVRQETRSIIAKI
ncbi:MAG: exoribonuclease II [Enterobacteriaceae bacterium]